VASRPRLLFIHIPKTAGTALVDVITREYGAGATARIYAGPYANGISVAELVELPRRRKRRVRAVVGHMAFGLHEHLPGASEYVTIVRDPVDRIVSHHGYVLGEPTLVDIHEATGEKATLVGHVRGSPQRNLVNDGQTRLLGGMLTDDRAQPGALELERAIERLDNEFAVVGIQERMDESMLLMARTLGWEHTDLPTINVTPTRQALTEITPEERAVIEEHNQLDRALYDHVLSRFDAKVATSA
jgi:hypothetical protein